MAYAQDHTVVLLTGLGNVRSKPVCIVCRYHDDGLGPTELHRCIFTSFNFRNHRSRTWPDNHLCSTVMAR